MKHNTTEQRPDILALARKAYDMGKKRIAAGVDATPQNIAVLNRVRALIDRRMQNLGVKK